LVRARFRSKLPPFTYFDVGYKHIKWLLIVVNLVNLSQSCQIFLGTTPKWGNVYQMAIKYTNWPWNRPNGHKIYQHLSLQHPPKLTRIGIFGLKMNHLATLIWTDKRFPNRKIHQLLGWNNRNFFLHYINICVCRFRDKIKLCKCYCFKIAVRIAKVLLWMNASAWGQFFKTGFWACTKHSCLVGP
jgi:hypothetical protein